MFIIFNLYAEENTNLVLEGGFSYGGLSYISGEISVRYNRFGISGYYFQQKIGETIQYSYAVTSYYRICDLTKLNGKNYISVVGGGVVSQSFIEATTSGTIISLNIGLISDYNIFSNIQFSSKMFFFIYQDGFSTPYSLNLIYPLSNNISISGGIQGISSLIIDKQVTIPFKIGGMIGVGYEF